MGSWGCWWDLADRTRFCGHVAPHPEHHGRPKPNPADAPAHPIAVRQDRQLFLGDDDSAQERSLSLREEVDKKLAAYGPDGPTKPKHALDFTRDLCYDKVGGQHLTASCMFCNAHLMSTGSTRVVDHFAKVCVLCPPAVKDFCVPALACGRKL